MNNCGYSDSNRYDEKAISKLTEYFLAKHGVMFDIQFHGSKDNTPDTDGFIRLREENEMKRETGIYLNKTVFFQLKGKKKKINPRNYKCERKVFDFCRTTNLPTILFVVDNLGGSDNKSTIYWYHFSNINIDILKSTDTGAGKVKIPNLEPLYSQEEDRHQSFYGSIKDLTQKDILQDLPVEIRNLSISYRNKLIEITTALYLLQDVSSTKYSKLGEILKIKEYEFKYLMKSLREKDLIFQSKDRIIFQDRRDEKGCIGIQLSYEGYSRINIDDLLGTFPEKRSSIFSNMAKINHPLVISRLEKEAEVLTSTFQLLKTSEEKIRELEIFASYSRVLPKKAVKIVEQILKESKGLDENILLKILEILGNKRIFFNNQKVIQKKLFSFLREFKPGTVIPAKAEKTLKEKIGYNIKTINEILYSPQLIFISDIESWGSRKEKWHQRVLIELLGGLLVPEYEGTKWQDEKTFSLYRGVLPATEGLKEVRGRTLRYLMNLYNKVGGIQAKQDILNAMDGATKMPSSYVKPVSGDIKLSKLVVKNTQDIIDFYIEILDDAKLSIVRRIDRQAVGFERSYGKELKNLDKLKTKISEKEDYGVLKIFSNVEILDEKGKYLGWNEREKIYKEKVSEFVEDLDEKTLPSWVDKLRKVLRSFEEDKELLSADYLRMFLEQVGEKKPELAEIILKELEEELNGYLQYIFVGLWKSSEHQKTRKRLLEWADEGKHLRQIVFTVEKVKELDYEILSKVFKKTKKGQEIDIYNLIIIALLNLYSSALKEKEKKKARELMIKCIKELTSLENTYWTRHAYKDQEILNDLEEEDYEKLIDHLVYAQSIEYHVEEILTPMVQDNPKLIAKLFEKRLIKENEGFSKEEREYYDAIPLDFDHLTEVIKGKEEVILPEILTWLEDDSISNFQIPYLLRAIWDLEEVMKYITKDKKFVLPKEVIHTIMSGYQGRIKLDGEFVKIYLKNYKGDEDRRSLMTFMSVPGGMVEGEYGFAEDLEKRLEYAESISKETKSVLLKKFIEEYKEFLRRRAEYERRTTEEEIAIRESRFKQ